MAHENIHEELMEAVSYHDLEAVKKCLANGADANYVRYKDEDEPNGLMQPTTPLRMVVFCISNADLDDEGLKAFAEIVSLLLKHGADPGPAMALAEVRYGKYERTNEPNLFMQVWDIIANAKK